MTCKTLESDLEKFRVAYPSVRVSVFSDCLVYKCKQGKAEYCSKEANALISKLGLPLVSIPNKYPFNNTYVIQSNEVDSI